MRGCGCFCVATIAGVVAGGLTVVVGYTSLRSDWWTRCHCTSRNPVDDASGELVELGVIRSAATNVVVEGRGWPAHTGSTNVVVEVSE